MLVQGANSRNAKVELVQKTIPEEISGWKGGDILVVKTM